MATEFTRLYRELSRVEASGKPYDVTYERERKALLCTMGHDVGEVATSTKPHKHHGRMARRRLKDKLQDSIVVDKKIERMRAKQILDVTAQNKEVRELLQSLNQAESRQQAQGTSRKMEDSFWTKYSTLFPDNPAEGEPRATGPVTAASTTTAADAPAARRESSRPKHVPFEPTRPRATSSLRKDFTTNRWSREERERINALYWEIKKPLMASKEAWKDYLQEFAARFRAYFPERDAVEITKKVKAFIKFRYMKEPGEREYWAQVRGSGCERDDGAL